MIISEWENPNNYKQRLKSSKDRFIEKVEMRNNDDCWHWIACKNSKGYGMMHFGGKMQSAHRISYKLFIGKIPNKLFVLHTCDNPSCVNPNHLFLGTNDDNMRDMHDKGRHVAPHGTTNGNSKINEDNVKEIRKLHQTNRFSLKEIGKMFDITAQNVWFIVHKKAWKHVK